LWIRIQHFCLIRICIHKVIESGANPNLDSLPCFIVIKIISVNTFFSREVEEKLGVKYRTVCISVIYYYPLTQLVLVRTVFYLCENAQNSHNFCSIAVLFFSLKDYIRGHLPMKIFLADYRYVLYSITADAIRTILGVHLAFMASAVTLQGT
jgi:hypothetical protein